MANTIIPILYESTTMNFSNDGIGTLRDVISCIVTEERNGIFELTMDYPTEGIHYEELHLDRLIKALPNESDSPQAFRIYRISKPLNGIVTVDAQHISYDLNAIPVAGFSASGIAISALDTLLRSAVISTGFTCASDITTNASTDIKEPCSVRACLGGREGSILDRWGGEYRFNNFIIELQAHRGQDAGITIEYGKNLIDISQEERIDNMYTGIMPYAKKNEENENRYYYISEKYITANSASTFAFPRILPIDFSEEFQETEIPSEQRLRELAQAYINNNDVGVPTISISIEFVPLWQTEEYKTIASLERVCLCDTVTIRFPRLGVNATAKVIKTVYNVLKERYESIELGDARSTFTNSVNNLQQNIQEVDKKFEDVPSMMSGVIEHATGLITGAKGGHVIIRPDADGKPQEILILDTDSIHTAKKVWRWNINGMGYSSNGMNGPYETAVTMDGHILGKFISALTIVGSQIVAGRIQSVNGNVYFDLEANEGKGEIAASRLIAPSNQNQTQATIGTVTVGDRRLEGIVVETQQDKGGKLALTVNERTINSSKNSSRIDSEGNLTISSNLIAGMSTNRMEFIDYNNQREGQISIIRGDSAPFDMDEDSIVLRQARIEITHQESVNIRGGRAEIIVGGERGAVRIDCDTEIWGSLEVDGEYITSDPNEKSDIKVYHADALPFVQKTPVYRYKLKRDICNNTRIGLMYGESPEEIQHESKSKKKAIDLYGMCALLWKAVQELATQVEELRERSKN